MQSLKLYRIQILGSLILLLGLIVSYGWAIGNCIITRLIQDHAAMKPVTAIGFVLSGLIIIISQKALQKKDKLFGSIIATASMWMLALHFMVLVDALSEHDFGFRLLFFKEKDTAPFTTEPGVPGIPAVISFILMSLLGISIIFNTPNLIKRAKLIGRTLIIIGSIALFGYVINAPLLYGWEPHISSALAIHTAAGILLMGVAACMISKSHTQMTSK